MPTRRSRSDLDMSPVFSGLDKLLSYIERQQYRGYDPYDALTSPLFKLPILRTNKLIRFATQQLVKRLPINVRPLLLVPKGYNPVTLGLCIQGYAYLCQCEPDRKEHHLKKINFLVKELKTMIPRGFSGACWGYDFDWEARHAKIPAYQPTVVATGIITNALFIAYQLTKDEELAKLVVSAAEFVKQDLNRTYDGDKLCFSYSPTDRQQVFNASMKGVRILAQAYSITQDRSLIELAERAVDFVVSAQNPDGSWGYSLAKGGAWTDNYHTGYVLDCLSEYQVLSKQNDLQQCIEKGYSYYVANFIEEDGMPRFYDNRSFPVDCTAASQTILTTLRFGDTELAGRVAQWMVTRMQKKNGSFAFRKYRFYTEKTSFMRWSDAWMFTAMCNLKRDLK